MDMLGYAMEQGTLSTPMSVGEMILGIIGIAAIVYLFRIKL